MEDEEDAYQHTKVVMDEIVSNKDIPGEQKEIAYGLMRNIFRIGRGMDNYEMSDLKEYLVQALDTIHNLMKEGRRESTEKMRKIFLASEEIYSHVDKIQDKIEEISNEVEFMDKGLEGKVVENITPKVEDKENNIYQDTTSRIEEIQKLDLTSQEEKEIAYRIGSAVLDLGNEIKTYHDVPLFVHDAFDVVYAMIQSGRNNKYDSPVMNEIAKDSERIIKYIQLIKTIIQKVDTNAQTLEKRLNKENAEREKIIGKIIADMRSQE